MKLALKLASLLLLALMLVPNAAYADSHGNGGNTCQNCDDGDNGDDEDDDRKKPKFQTRFFGD